MRMEKIKSTVSLKRALEHNTREKVPSNSNPDLIKANYSPKSAAICLSEFNSLKPEKVRKNAVLAVEVVLTASAESLEKMSIKNKKGFLVSCGKWVGSVFGKENILSIDIHMDEKTAHVHVIAIPLVDGKLNAKAFIGGSKFRMRELQDDFYEKVGKPFGLDRGIERKNVSHTDVNEFPKIMANMKKELETEKRIFKEEVANEKSALKSKEFELNKRSAFLATATKILEKKFGVGEVMVAQKLANYFHGLNEVEKRLLDAQFLTLADKKRAEKGVDFNDNFVKLPPVISNENTKKGGRK